jgi:integrase
MPRLSLTEKAILKMKAPAASKAGVIYWDTGLRGFGVQCSGISTTKSFIAQRDHNGKTRRVKIGRVGEMPLIEAHDLATTILIDLRKGISPACKPDSGMTLRTALESYLGANRDLSPVSAKVYRQQVERTLTQWLDWPLRDITADMVEKRHREIADKISKDGTGHSGKSTANGALRVLRILWNFAADRIPDMPRTNPVRRLKKQWFAEPRRTRMIPFEKMPDFYRAVRSLDNEVARDLLLLLMFTGFRKGEASSLRWQNIDLQQRTITVPAEKTKAKRALILPMSDFVHALLVARRNKCSGDFVFPGPGKHGHISDLQGPLKAIAGQTGLVFSPHDLRRGFSTCAETLNISMTHLKMLLNHAPSRDVTSGYIVLGPERLQLTVQRIANRLEELCGITDPTGGNVRRLARSNA